MPNEHQTGLNSGRERLIEIVKAQTLQQGQDISSTDVDAVLAEFTDEQLAQLAAKIGGPMAASVGLDDSGDDSAEDPLSAAASALHAELVGHFAAGAGLPLALHEGKDLPLALLFEPFLEAKRLKPSTAASYRTAFERLQAVIGEKTASEVTPEDLDRFCQELERAQSNKGTREALTATTVTKYRSHICSFFAAVAGDGTERANPAETMEKPVSAAPSPTSSKQVAFSEEQLARLFAAPIFTGCEDDHHITRPGKFLCRDGRFWFVGLKLYAGVRSGETQALLTTDILRHHGIWHIDIHNDSRTGAGNRLIPVHPKLLEMGFLEWVEERRDRVGEGRLFEPRKYARIWNDWILKAVGLKSEGLTVEGLRSNFLEAIATSANDELVRRLSGQSTGASCDRYLTREKTRRASRITDRIWY